MVAMTFTSANAANTVKLTVINVPSAHSHLAALKDLPNSRNFSRDNSGLQLISPFED